MVSPKRKAEELIWKYLPILEGWTDDAKTDLAKRCALICVEEIVDAIDFDWMEIQNLDRQHAFWQQVKEELK